MSSNITYLHSHSGLERTIRNDKDITKKRYVLVDERFKPTFADIEMEIKPFEYRNVKYYKVPILAFVHKGGVFKNLES